jgi:HD-GYP domain-containing protein (c-di-GMP phosphodiesterase class II)/DNA-binding CsgD family transcriptional regulator
MTDPTFPTLPASAAFTGSADAATRDPRAPAEPDDPAARVPVLDAIRALAFVGDLSMGQPVDHSARTAWLAARLAGTAGADRAAIDEAACVALLRWSGCTANAPEFSTLLGDDVRGRDTMLTTASAAQAAAFAAGVGEMALIHCEVAGEIARMLGLPASVELALRHVFENWNGLGAPAGLRGDQVPAAVYHVALAGDLEIFSRAHGLPAALRQIAERADARYPRTLVDLVIAHAAAWLAALDDGAHEQDALALDATVDASRHDAGDPTSGAAHDGTRSSAIGASLAKIETPLALVADVIDLKLPWMTGLSRRVAEAARATGAALGLDAADQARLHRAGLLHGIGRASVPNALWNEGRRLGEADRERLRLMPYWTGRAARRLSALTAEAELASYVDERLDGSGAFRGVAGAAIPRPARVLIAAACWVTLRTARPGRPAATLEAARATLRAEARAGRLDVEAVEALCGAIPRTASTAASTAAAPGTAGAVAATAAPPQAATAGDAIALSAREAEVLARIAVGDSNKEAARELGISPSTVRTHLESAFRKLGCSTRAAATLKAMTLGLLPV